MYIKRKRTVTRVNLRCCLLLVLLSVAVGGLHGDSYGADRRIILNVQTEPTPWGESRLANSLVRQLGRSADLRIVTPDMISDFAPPFPLARHDPDSLIDWGREIGGQYLLIVDVRNESLTTKKTFSIPLIMHKWKTVGVIEADARLLDLQRGRVLMNDSFVEELTGRRALQGDPDNNGADPDLHISAPEKRTLMDRLEDRLAGRLVRKEKKLVRSR